MLARTFLSAEQLGIPEEWKDALHLVLEAMDRGEFEHHSMLSWSSEALTLAAFQRDTLEQNHSGLFNLSVWRGTTPCGTVVCMGGAAEILGKVSFHNRKFLWTRRLSDLFLPEGIFHQDYEKVTVKQARTALYSYLSTGNANWEAAVYG